MSKQKEEIERAMVIGALAALACYLAFWLLLGLAVLKIIWFVLVQM